ncbi:MAG: ABC transporter ATP-binding protein [Crocinitomicaceae bacterium]|nr:ABC transporter ATP-binding protein [Crocinitomicaceae bacterium]
MIEFKSVHIGYNKSLFEISKLTLEKGKLYILVGKNGSGKSTLLKSITKQIPVLNGTISLNGKNISQLKDHQVAQNVAFVRSTFPQVDFLSVIDFIGLGRTPHTNAFGRLSAIDKDAVNRAIDLLKLHHLQNKFTSELSDGERQLVALARAIAQSSEVIILDEPTAFLDYSNKLIVLETLKDLASKLDKCIVLSSHDIDLAIESKSDFLVLPKDGSSPKLLPAPIDKKQLLEMTFL